MRAVTAGLTGCMQHLSLENNQRRCTWGRSFEQHEQPPKLFTTNLPT
jgi:hypothetical protein